MTTTQSRSPFSIALPKNLRYLAEAAVATAAIALIANVGAAGALTQQEAQTQPEPDASVLVAEGPLQQSIGFGPLEPLVGDITPAEAARRQAEQRVNAIELEDNNTLGAVVRLVEIEVQ